MTVHHIQPVASSTALATTMDDFARFKARKAIPCDAAVEAMVLARDIIEHKDTPQNIIARLRAAAMLYRPTGQMTLVAYMELIAARMEYERKQ